MFYLIFIYITLLKLHGNELCLAILQRSTCINSFSLSQFQSSQVQSTLGLLRRWRGRMIGCYRQQRKAAVGTTTTTSRPAVLLSVCLCLSSLNDSWLWRYGSAGYMRAVTHSSQHLRQLLQLVGYCSVLARLRKQRPVGLGLCLLNRGRLAEGLLYAISI